MTPMINHPLTPEETHDPAHPKPYVPYAGNPQNATNHNLVVVIDGTFIPKFVRVYEHLFDVTIRPANVRGDTSKSVVTGPPDSVKRFLMNHYGSATAVREKHPNIVL